MLDENDWMRSEEREKEERGGGGEEEDSKKLYIVECWMRMTG
jgi:hypothetical protein